MPKLPVPGQMTHSHTNINIPRADIATGWQQTRRPRRATSSARRGHPQTRTGRRCACPDAFCSLPSSGYHRDLPSEVPMASGPRSGSRTHWARGGRSPRSVPGVDPRRLRSRELDTQPGLPPLPHLSQSSPGESLRRREERQRERAPAGGGDHQQARCPGRSQAPQEASPARSGAA